MRLYRDRADAANRLVDALPDDLDGGWLVLALPRGGVPIAEPIARHLGAVLDILTVRKVGTPGNPELALAAVTGGRDADIWINPDVQRMTGLSEDRAREMARDIGRTIDARRRDWVGDRPPPDLVGQRVLIVDDGAATGTTLGAAVDAARRAGARAVAVALPVALHGALRAVQGSADRIICPHPDAPFSAVGAAYDRFDQVSDADVSRLLRSSGPESG